MIPLIEAKVVDERQWISREELLDLMAVAQSCPGIFAVNIAIFIGYKIRGTWGALMATLGCILPSFLITAPTFKMAKSAQISRYNIWIPVLGAFLIWMFGVSPIWVIIAAGLGGYLYGKYITNV